jgi:arylsulfatase A-like enzyme
MSVVKPNIFLIVIDSFRSDTCHGKNKTSLTPNIDNLIKNGVYFSKTFCSSSTTGSSTGSMFTGLFPFKTGMGGETYRKLNSKNIVYTDILKDQGYHPFAFLPSNEIVTMGLPFGFGENYETYQYQNRLFDGLGNKITKKLSTLSDNQPWFFYTHLLDLHSPVSPPKEFDNEKFGLSKYERMVSAIDFWIGKFLEKIEIKNTLVIVTADHGEYIPLLKIGDEIISFETGSKQKSMWKLGAKIPSFLFPYAAKLNSILLKKNRTSKFSKISQNLSDYQKRTLLTSRMDLHNRVYDELLHIPLIFSGCCVPSNDAISELVRNVDIFPTICDLANLNGIHVNIHGRSLQPMIENKQLEELPLYIESPPSIEQSTQHVTGIRTSQFKYFRDTKNPKKNISLFDLEKDPHEENNIAQNNAQITENLEKILIELLDDSKLNSTQNSDDETKKIENELRKMGYL